MLSFLFLAYITFIILIIAKNYKSINVIWLCIMLIGFCCAFFGFAFYTEYISSSAYYTESRMFSNVSQYIWTVNYYLDLDILSEYRIINIGIALYILGALCFPVSYVKNRRIRKYVYIFSPITPALIIFMFDPESLVLLLGLRGKDYLGALYTYQSAFLVGTLNNIFNILIKIYICLSIAAFLFVYRRTLPMKRKKLVYMISGIVPVHLLFLILFFWFPNHKVVFARYTQLASFSLPYNEFLYGLVTCFALLSIILVIYAMWKYNIFEISRAYDRVAFQKQFNTAQVGLKVFSHSIKNQIIAINLLSEQLESAADEGRRKVIIREIRGICASSLEKLGTAFKEMGVVKLNYESVNVGELVRNIVMKHKKINTNVEFACDAGKEPVLYLDAGQFEKVIDNFIINAIEACNGTEKPKIKVSVEERHYYAVVTVTDNGSGMDRKIVKKIFDPFFSTKPMSSNWGIGLSYCQKVMEAFGGAIQIDSLPGRGTTVRAFILMDGG